MMGRVLNIRQFPQELIWKCLEKDDDMPQCPQTVRREIGSNKNKNISCSQVRHKRTSGLSKNKGLAGSSEPKTPNTTDHDGLAIRGKSIKPIEKRRQLKSPYFGAMNGNWRNFITLNNTFVEEFYLRGSETPGDTTSKADPDNFTSANDQTEPFDMKLNEKNIEENGKMGSDFITPGYVRQMINRFSSGYSNDYINGIADGNASEDEKNQSSICSFNKGKLPLLHSTRSSFKSEKPKPFHYPVLLANRSSIPTFFDKSYSKSSSCNEQSSLSRAEEEPRVNDNLSSNGLPHQSPGLVDMPVLIQLDEDSGKHSSCGSSQATETLNGFSDSESLPPVTQVNNCYVDGVTDIHGATKSVKDGIYFLNIMGEKEKALNERCMKFESSLGPDMPDEASGKIRSAIGKANLLTSKKFPQFAGLCHKNLISSQEMQFQVTCEDLEGFWDLVMIQVMDVEASFAELEELRRNSWKEDVPQDELHTSHTSSKQETPTRGKESFTPAKSSARKGKSLDLTVEKLRLRAAMQKGRRQRKTSQNEEEVQIFVAEKS